MAHRKTTQEKREARKKKAANTKVKAKSADPLDQLVASINKDLGGEGYIYTGAEFEEKQYGRRLWGVPTCDYVLAGGMPKPGLVEIGGQYSSGKTTLCIKACAKAQKDEPHLAIGWIALEPFDPAWARRNGLWIPFKEGQELTEAEWELMGHYGWEDPYGLNGLARVVIVQDERGDVALDTTMTMLKSNLFSIIVVDSLGVAKNTKFIEEQEVQDASDFPREPRMLGNYTARALLAMNAKYDENGKKAQDGKFSLQTTVLNINQIGVAIGTQARSPWKKHYMKGGEAIKHNHHAILYVHTKNLLYEKVKGEGYYYGKQTQVTCIKSKIGPPFLSGEFNMYFRDWGEFRAGDIDTTDDAITLGLRAGLLRQAGAWLYLPMDEGEEEKFQGRNALKDWLMENTEWLDWLVAESISVLKENL